MLALVIDTSSAAVAAAVVDVAAEPFVRAERSTINARAHSELLSPAVAECLREVGIGRGDLAAVVAGVGPGPFTGLRVGLVTAAALALAFDVPTYGVGSLDGIAGSVDEAGALLVAGDARRREVYWALYAGGRCIAGPAVGTATEVAEGLAGAPPVAMAGAGARAYRDVLPFPLLDHDYPSVAALAAAASDRIRAGAPTETLVPAYLRDPDAKPYADSRTR
ncbi:MAG: tRNA (adenosine(37)-N6)-threonylcarbamoyltransferase complex dimerization subunit type 1 TsaB [Jatrophihabitans sp.]